MCLSLRWQLRFLCRSYALFTRPASTNFSKFFFKIRSHSTINTFKNYFATVFLVFNNKRYPNRLLVLNGSHTLFHPHIFSHIFSNNNFQFLSTYTKHPLSFYKVLLQVKKVREKKKIYIYIYIKGRERLKKKKNSLFYVLKIVCLCQMINLMVL